MIVGPSIWGIYGAYYEDGRPSQVSVSLLVLYCAIVGVIRSYSVDGKFVDTSLNPIERLKRTYRVFFLKP